jgi:hypothetical protein
VKRDLGASYQNIGGGLAAEGKLQGALDFYRQSLRIFQTLCDKDISNLDRQRDLITALYKVATTMARIGGIDNPAQAEEHLLKGRNLAKLYSGVDREKLIDDFNVALRNQIHRN